MTPTSLCKSPTAQLSENVDKKWELISRGNQRLSAFFLPSLDLASFFCFPQILELFQKIKARRTKNTRDRDSSHKIGQNLIGREESVKLAYRSSFIHRYTSVLALFCNYRKARPATYENKSERGTRKNTTNMIHADKSRGRSKWRRLERAKATKNSLRREKERDENTDDIAFHNICFRGENRKRFILTLGKGGGKAACSQMGQFKWSGREGERDARQRCSFQWFYLNSSINSKTKGGRERRKSRALTSFGAWSHARQTQKIETLRALKRA